MNCDTMLEVMLDAEPAELEGQGTSVLAAHVRECAKCRAAAGQLVGDSRMLAEVVTHESPAPALDVEGFRRRERYVTPKAAGALLIAASLLLAALWGGDPRPADVTAPPRVANDVPRAVGAGPHFEHRPGGYEAEGLVKYARPVAVAPRPIRLAAISTAPTIADPAPVEPHGNDAVTVTPPAGTRATIMRAATPGVTVVWFH